MNAVQTLIIGVIGVLVGVVLIGPVTTTVQSLVSSTGALASTETDFASSRALVILVPLIFVACILVIPIYLIWSKMSKNGGGM